jgi:hypothetical protein
MGGRKSNQNSSIISRRKKNINLYLRGRRPDYYIILLFVTPPDTASPLAGVGGRGLIGV